jgi:hypothetical protein
MTTAQKTAMTGAAGDQVYDSTLKRPEFHDGVAWRGAGAIKSVVSKTTTYAAAGNDDVILCSTAGGAWTLTLPAAASHVGKSLIIKKTSNDFTELTIATNSTETIDGVDGSALHTQYEQLEIISDGSNWHIIERRIPSTWTSFTPTTAGLGTIATNSSQWRRVGDSVQIQVKFTTGTVTTTEARVNLPTGTVSSAFSAITSVGRWVRGTSTANTVKGGNVRALAGDAYLTFSFDDYTTNTEPLSSGKNGDAMLTNSNTFSFYATVPVTGWNG